MCVAQSVFYVFMAFMQLINICWFNIVFMVY